MVWGVITPMTCIPCASAKTDKKGTFFMVIQDIWVSETNKSEKRGRKTHKRVCILLLNVKLFVKCSVKNEQFEKRIVKLGKYYFCLGYEKGRLITHDIPRLWNGI